MLAVGTRLGDVTTQGYIFPTAPRPKQRLIHVYDDPDVLGAVFATDLAVLADPLAFLRAFAERATAKPGRFSGWAERLHRVPAGMARWEPKEAADGVVFGAVIQAAMVVARSEDPDASKRQMAKTLHRLLNSL